MKLIHSILVILIIAITTFIVVSLDKKNLDINIKIPNTDNYKLNKIINNEVNKYKLEFIKNAKDSKLKTKYHLYIDYKEYKYGNYVSYVFFIENFTGGAHPNHRIKSVVYDTLNNKVISIDDLISYNDIIINIISDYTRCVLINNKDIDVSMMYEGTKKIKSNFNTFALTNDGLLIFFERYQVAPYYKGEFEVLIPYKYVK